MGCSVLSLWRVWSPIFNTSYTPKQWRKKGLNCWNAGIVSSSVRLIVRTWIGFTRWLTQCVCICWYGWILLICKEIYNVQYIMRNASQMKPRTISPCKFERQKSAILGIWWLFSLAHALNTQGQNWKLGTHDWLKCKHFVFYIKVEINQN